MFESLAWIVWAYIKESTKRSDNRPFWHSQKAFNLAAIASPNPLKDLWKQIPVLAGATQEEVFSV